MAQSCHQTPSNTRHGRYGCFRNKSTRRPPLSRQACHTDEWPIHLCDRDLVASSWGGLPRLCVRGSAPAPLRSRLCGPAGGFHLSRWSPGSLYARQGVSLCGVGGQRSKEIRLGGRTIFHLRGWAAGVRQGAGWWWPERCRRRLGLAGPRPRVSADSGLTCRTSQTLSTAGEGVIGPVPGLR